MASLRNHHELHLQNGRDFDKALKERILGMTSRDCKKLDKAVRSHHESLEGKHRLLDRELDNETGFGRVNGVELR